MHSIYYNSVQFQYELAITMQDQKGIDMLYFFSSKHAMFIKEKNFNSMHQGSPTQNQIRCQPVL